ncbi:MAG: hypothetical protein O9272_00415 [Brevundimonas sp.]|nr:hypothetical protein [Brevundimonas sp.]
MPKQIGYVGEVIVHQRLADAGFSPDAIHGQRGHPFACHDLGDVIKDQRLPLFWGEANALLHRRFASFHCAGHAFETSDRNRRRSNAVGGNEL